MYRYDEFDRKLIRDRARQFRGQVQRHFAGETTEDEFKQLRLRNGLYYQLHAYMLRVAIPYGLLTSKQLRVLGRISERYDRGFGHFTTRQNIQYNWLRLEDVPDLLDDLADVDMHAIQTSGNAVRNITSDHLAGVAADELEDPRPYCELVRQWSTLHPEFSWLPRKFKIAITGSAVDRVALELHDIGLRIVDNADGERGFEVYVGGGMGRTPVIGRRLRPFLPVVDLLAYLEAILRIYNLEGRRDNIHKARIKILVNALGIDAFREKVEAEFASIGPSTLQVTEQEVRSLKDLFQPHEYSPESTQVATDSLLESVNPAFAAWKRHNTLGHKQAGYRIVFVSLKAPGVPPGDVTARQMEAVAELADRFSFGQIRATHDQNLVLAEVREDELAALWRGLNAQGLASANIGTLNDMICCPGLDYCSLANAGTIDIARQINAHFDRLETLYELGPITLKMSGCMNACGHHHIGNIGILGVEKHGKEWYQLTLGGEAGRDARLGDRLGAAIEKHRVAEVIGKLLDVYVEHRRPDESFIDTYHRVGLQIFKDQVYGTDSRSKARRGSVAA